MQLDLLSKESSVMQEKQPPARSSDEEKSPSAFKTISEVADQLGVPQHVLRFWESKFPQIKPTKLRGGRRYYRPEDVEILTKIQHLLYKEGYTIKGAKKAFHQAKDEPEVAEAKTKPSLSERQQSQLTVIRRELAGIRELLKPHLPKN